MDASARAALEAEIRRHFDAGDLAAAATAALRGYGPEIYGLVAAVMRDHDAAEDVYAEFSLELWRYLPRFRWDASIRTWAYAMARRATARYLAAPAQRPRRRVPLSDLPEAAAVVAAARSSTATWRRSEARATVDQLRAALAPDDQTLLVLRIDRRLPWIDVAQIMEEAEPTLRKRYERLKRRLREAAGRAPIR